MKARLEIRDPREGADWKEIATCATFGDAAMLAQAAARACNGVREYRAIERHKSGGSVEFISFLPITFLPITTGR